MLSAEEWGIVRLSLLVGGTATVNDQLLAENIDSGLFNPSPPSPLTPARLESNFLSVSISYQFKGN